MRSLLLLAGLAVPAVNAQIAGFNYGSTFSNNKPMQQSDFEDVFKRAKTLPGTSGRFTSARLFTSIQAGTANTPISAIPAAINTQTRLLLGIWASAGPDVVTNEITALISAANQYGNAFVDLIDGISVGSEDLYRISPIAAGNDEVNPGAQPALIADYIRQVRSAVQFSPLRSKSIGHVDTWTAWVNGSNSAVIDAVDWIGMDAYPYFQNTMENSIDVANSTFWDAYDITVSVSKGKDIWVTETGWPSSGATQNHAIASVQNAARYWAETACSLIGRKNVWWYDLWAGPVATDPNFALIAPDNVHGDPLFPLACSGSPSTPSSSIPTVSTTVSSPAMDINLHHAVVPRPSDDLPYGPGWEHIQLPHESQWRYQNPHLIIPVSASQPDKAFGTQFDGTINADTSTIFNFDIPDSYSGKTCSVVFLFSNPVFPYTFNNKGGMRLSKLDTYSTQQTTFANKLSGQFIAGIDNFQRQNYVLTSARCASGQTIAYELESTNGLELNYFEGGNPTPQGLFITVC